MSSESQGQPISGKFEVDEGHFQLSVYTAQGSAFQEVIVDYTTGTVAKSGPLDAAARQQMAAMAKAKTSLKAATDKAEQENAGYRAVSVTPMLKANHAVATVTLVKGAQFKSVSESLE